MAERKNSAGEATEQAPGGEKRLRESSEVAEPRTESSVARETMIREAAYYRAEQRQFEPGYAVEDWLAAEQEVDSRLTGSLDPARLIERLQRERDELRVKIHLTKLELREEWEELEQKWDRIKTRSGGAVKEAREAGKDVGAATRSVLEEIREGYRRIRGAL